MANSGHTIAELLRGPIIAVDERTLVGKVMQLSEENGVHYFAIQRAGKVTGRACTCDMRDGRPQATIGDHMRPLLMTLSPDTTLQAALAVLGAGMDWTVVEDSNSHLLGVVTWHDIEQLLDGFDPTRGHFCHGCGADHCLQKARNHTLLCPECYDRAKYDDWYDLGAAG